jgi:serine protease Do
MHLLKHTALAAVATLLLLGSARADKSFAKIADDVNQKTVKLFGSGGFKGLVAYGTGILVSPEGHILTVANHLLDTPDLRVHLADGRRFHAKLVATEPLLDVALIQIEGVKNLPYFDVPEAAKKPVVDTGTGILAFSNEFEVATRDEPMSIMRGLVSSYSKLHGRRGIFDASFRGEVYIVDGIICNPGAAGGPVTTRKGELLGIIGRELRNTLTDTWVNYAMPIQSRVEAKQDDKVVSVTLAEFVELAKAGKYAQLVKKEKNEGPGGYSGIVLVPNILERTPPYIDAVTPNSPAAKAGFKPDDLIVYVNGEQVGSIKAFFDLVGRAPPGTEFRIDVRRKVEENDKLVTLELKIAEWPAKAAPKK